MAEPPRYNGFNNPGMAEAAGNLASLFGPPSAHDVYAYSQAGMTREKMKVLQGAATVFADPNATPEARDRAAGIAGLYAPNAGERAVNMGDATKRYQVDQDNSTKVATTGMHETAETGRNKYTSDNSLLGNMYTADTNRKSKLDSDMVAPIQRDAVRNVPPSIAKAYDVPQVQQGNIEVREGGKVVTPNQGTIEGNAKPLTSSEIFNYTQPDGKKGTAVTDPTGRTLIDSQSHQPLPQGGSISGAGNNSTTVNVGPNGEPFGAPPTGMAWARDAGGKVKLDERGAPVALTIGGTPQDVKNQHTSKANAEKETADSAKNDVMTQDIARTLEKVRQNPGLTTGLGSLTTFMPGSPGHDVQELLRGIKANIGFDRLQNMRNSSPTGGALGQVSDTENKMLQATMGSLEQSQTKEQFEQNLTRLQDQYADIVHGGKTHPQGTQGPPRSYEPTAIGPNGQRMFLRNGKLQPVQ